MISEDFPLAVADSQEEAGFPVAEADFPAGVADSVGEDRQAVGRSG